MPDTQGFGVYAAEGTRGDQVSSTYEGRHVTLYASELVSHLGAGSVVKGYPVVFGTVGLQGVGIAFNTTAVAGDMVAIDTEGIWNVQCVAVDDAGNSLISGGDPLFINTATCVVSKIRNIITQIPFGYALGQVIAGGTAVIAVKVHWDHPDADGLDALMLPGGSKQDILDVSLTKNYQIGARLELPASDGRIFHYCRASSTVGCASQHGCSVRSDRVFQGDGAQPAIAINSQTVTMTTTEVILANELDGGWFGGYSDRGTYHILSQPDAATGANVVLNLARPTYRAMGGGGNRLYAYPNIYSQCQWPDVARLNLQGWSTVVAWPLIDVAVNEYFWGQTWGPILMICGTWGNQVGTRVNEREVHFDWDGNIVHRGIAQDIDKWMQRAGYLMFDGREATGGDQFVYLQLTP